MKKKLNKLIIFALIFTMALGMLPMTSYARDNSIKANVVYEDAKNETLFPDSDNEVTSITVENIEYVEGTNGSWAYYGWDVETQQWTGQYWRYSTSPESITINYNDGSSITGNQWEIQDQTGYDVIINCTQDENNRWTAGNSYDVTVSFMGVTDTFQISITETPVASIVVADIELVEGTNGSWAYYGWDVETQQWTGQYWRYSTSPESITINYNDGSSITGSQWEIQDQTGYDVIINCTQDENNRWTAGNSYDVTASFMGVTDTFQVSITETPVASIVVADIEIVEGTNGYWEDCGWDEETQQYTDQYWRYPVSPESITVNYKDGSTLTGDRWEIETQTGYDVGIRYTQDENNRWTVGNSYDVTASFMGVTGTFQVSIVETPVASITIADIELVEGTNGYWEDCGWDEETQQYTDQYWRYSVSLESITVNYKDGSSITGSLWEIQNQTGYSVDINYTQDENNRWTVGNNYDVTVSFMGTTGTFQISITETPVASITIADIELVECTNGYWVDCGWDEDTQQWTDQYWYYWFSPESITVNYKDGSSITGSQWEIQNRTGYGMVISYVPQGENNRWTAGNSYDVTATFMGVTVTFQVSIVETPVASIVVEDVTLREEVDGYWSGRSNNNRDHMTQCWFYYNVNPVITVNFKDGTTITGDSRYISDTLGYSVGLDYSYPSEENQWIAGNSYPVKVTLMGKETTYNITIAESPIASITTEPINKYFGSSSINIKSIKVTLKDGRVINTVGTKVVIDGTNYSPQIVCETPEAYKDWTTGEQHTCTLRLGGKSTTFTCTVVDSPINSISIDDMTVLKNATSNAYYSCYPQYVNVRLNDGREMQVECNSQYIVVNGQTLNITFEDKQNEQPWGVGKHRVKAIVGGVSAYYNIEVVDAIKNIIFDPIELYKGNGGGSIYNNLNYTIEFNDGTKKQYQGQGFYYKGRYYYFSLDYNAEIPLGTSTQKVYLLGKSYNVSVTLRDSINSISISNENGFSITLKDALGNEKTVNALYINPTSNSEYVNICTNGGFISVKLKYGTDITNNVSIELNGIKSNTLSKCDWFKAVQNVYGNRVEAVISKMTEGVDNLKLLSYSSGKVTTSNIDLIIEYALRFSLDQDMVDNALGYYAGGYIYSEDYAKQRVEKVFGIEDIDISQASRFDSEHGYYCSGGSYGSNGYKYVLSSTAKVDDDYVYTLINHDTDETCKIVFDGNGIIQSITYSDADQNHSMEHHPRIEPTYTAVGNIEYWYCSECGKYFSDAEGVNEITQEQTIIPKKEVPSIEGTFSDVNKDEWFYDSVAFVYATGIMTGMGGTNNFAPFEPLLREQFAVILYRLEGKPAVQYENKFYDVPAGTWYTDPIIWAYKNKVITGYVNGYYGVGDCITREQFATMLYRYAKDVKHITISGSADISGFVDASQVSSWAYEAISWAVGNGIISGKDNKTRLDPHGNAARCEAAAMIERFMNKYGL